MKAPEKIYMPLIDLKEIGNVLAENNDSTDVEYTRTDAFIEKATQWLEKEYLYNGSMAAINPELIASFKKAMEE